MLGWNHCICYWIYLLSDLFLRCCSAYMFMHEEKQGEKWFSDEWSKGTVFAITSDSNQSGNVYLT